METFLAISRSAYLCKKIWEEGEDIPFRELLIIGVIDSGIRKKSKISKRLMRDNSSISKEIDELHRKGFLYREKKDYYLTERSEEIIKKSNSNKEEILSEIFFDTTSESRSDFLNRLLKLEKGLLKYLSGNEE